MRSFVTGLYWFTNAFSSAIAQAFVLLAVDPLLTWGYTAIACITFVGMVVFWLCFRKLDLEEDALNALPESAYKRRKNTVVDMEALREEQTHQGKIRKSKCGTVKCWGRD